MISLGSGNTENDSAALPAPVQPQEQTRTLQRPAPHIGAQAEPSVIAPDMSDTPLGKGEGGIPDQASIGEDPDIGPLRMLAHGLGKGPVKLFVAQGLQPGIRFQHQPAAVLVEQFLTGQGDMRVAVLIGHEPWSVSLSVMSGYEDCRAS